MVKPHDNGARNAPDSDEKPVRFPDRSGLRSSLPPSREPAYQTVRKIRGEQPPETGQAQQ